ncbi:branched-chain amino acid permease [Caldimonas brevitalea]|uniref:Branched-chain amino acid permease n=2 Tax=Caldimonas brevitalea TaxID=413882 RepID=A0A0G3BYB4_9BURK|nr:branched-chain amino acid permease [Caldimonas brevitalea]
MGYVPLGAVFGYLLVQAGAVWWMAPLTSLLVFAGAAQFMAIPMLAAGAPLGSIVLATLIVNLRHVFYGLSLLDKLPQRKLARWYLIWALTDENYSVITTLPAGTSSTRMVAVAMLNHGWWVLGTLLGAAIGLQAPTALTGIDFSLAALFAVLTAEQWRATRRPAPILLALASYGVARWVAPSQALAVAIGLCVVLSAILSRSSSSNNNKSMEAST